MTVPKRFGIIRFFGTLLKVIAWIALVFSIIGAIGFVVAGSSSVFTEMLGTALPGQSTDFASTGGGILGGIGILFLGLVYFLLFYIGGEFMHMQLAVEENTRLTAALLLKMHQEGQVEESQSYGADGGFVNEPYES